MDPLTQGTLGALYAQAVSRKHRTQLVVVTVIGFLAGMLADLDILIQSEHDPLLYLEYHRHFTHSLFFVPFGALFAALALFGFFRRSLSFKQVYFYSFVGYLTHAPLDACTSYGTLLLWPVTDYRFSWDFISIIDPLFTLPLLLVVIVSAYRRSSHWVRWGVVWSLLYLAIGSFQNDRAKDVARELAESRGHFNVEIQVKPSFANLMLWKSIYEFQERYYVDAIHISFSKKIYPGESIQRLELSRDFSWLDSTDTQADDVQRFRWFSQGYVAVHPKDPEVIGDVRYSLLPNEIDPLWGIRLRPDRKGLHTPFESTRSITKEKREKFFQMLRGQ